MASLRSLVIGTGPAGQKAAVQAAKLGKKVGIIERKGSRRRRLHQHRHDPQQIPPRSGLVSLGVPPAQPVWSGLSAERRPSRSKISPFAPTTLSRTKLRSSEPDGPQPDRSDLRRGQFPDPHRLLIQQASGSIEHSARLHRHRRRHRTDAASGLPFDDRTIIDTDGSSRSNAFRSPSSLSAAA